LWPEIRRRIRLFLQLRLGMSKEEAEALHRYFVSRYGTTLRGLQNEYPQVDPHDYFAFAHDIALERYLKPDPQLHSALCSLPGKRWLFTNADAAHAKRVIAILGVGDCIHGIIDIFATELIPKPNPKAYALARQIAGSPPPECCVLVDDLPQNLPPAKAAGWRTVLIGSTQSPKADIVLPNIYRLARFFTEGKLWSGCS